MSPALIAIFGPLKGSTLPLDQDELIIGRDPSNQIAVSDPLLSRKHCAIRRNSEQVTLTDLNSRNGISVNGIPTKERVLSHGDQIQMGDSLFLFVSQDTPTDAGEETPEQEAFSVGSTTQLKIDEAWYLNPEKARSAIPAAHRAMKDLNALVKISTTLNSMQDPESLQDKLLELLFEIVPAERGLISLTGRPSRALPKPFRVTRHISDQALNQKEAILVNNNAQSLLCVPLAVHQNILGYLYLDTTDAVVMLDEGHLQLVTAAAAIAAIALKNSLDLQWLVEENKRLQSGGEINHGMVGESTAIKRIYQMIEKVAPADSTILIAGESGTGKELVAQAIHRNSARANKPFVAINCAAVVETLLESEFFGHEKGAFTGAIAQKKGKIEIAEGGTLFLDEVTELSPALQAKLLRVLQEREFERVGGTRPIKADIRFIAATNRSLAEAVQKGTFRNDLYYRLNVVTIQMPSLRDRAEDIPLLASYFASEYGKKLNRHIKGISPEARDLLLHYEWPGNVRELQNTIERAIVLGSTELILPEDLPENLLESGDVLPSTQYHEGVKQAKRQLLQKALAQSNGNMNEAATLLGVNLTYLYRLIRNLKLK